MLTFPFARTLHGDIISFNLGMANRHGLIAGATGTGKTVTLQTLAEQFSEAGVSVFTADVKGDLSGIALLADENPKLKKRIDELKIANYTPHGNPVIFWDIYCQTGHPLRTTIDSMGPLLMGRLLNLNDTQQGLLNAAFSFAKDESMQLVDLKDLKSVVEWMGTNADTMKVKYGNIASTSIGAIQRSLLTLKEAGGDQFFGEPNFDVNQLFQKDASGKGLIHILDATKLVSDPRLYTTFLMWLLTALFEVMPEVGDQDKPKLTFFFDEAHLMFDSAPKPLLDKVEQLVRLIRSKGVGVYFITQSPLDVPEDVLGQLGNRVQHALRAFTPKDQKAVRVAAETFRSNPKLDTAQAIVELGVGEALISILDDAGKPTIVERAAIYPPASRIGPITAAEKTSIIKSSPFYGQYEQAVNRQSANEMLEEKMASKVAAAAEVAPKEPGRPRQSATEALIKSTARSFGTQVGRQIVKSILSVLSGKK
ncbi:MAG: helicase HerA-like domain-containing protein [Gammaproteobacteria bacterium]